jgi:hypothetical protein
VSYTIAVLIGAIVGVVTGVVFERLPLAPIIQSTAAGALAPVFAALTSAVVWLVSPPPPTAIKAVSIGGLESVFMVAASSAVAAALHFALGRVVGAAWPSLTAHRVILVSILGSLWGALSFVGGSGLVTPLGK